MAPTVAEQRAFGVPIAMMAITFTGAILTLIAFTAPEWYTATVRTTDATTGAVTQVDYRFGLWQLCPFGLDTNFADASKDDRCERITDRSRQYNGICMGPSKRDYPRAAQGFVVMALFAAFVGLTTTVLAATTGQRCYKVLTVLMMLSATLFSVISSAVFYGFMSERYCSDGATFVCRPSANVTCDEYTNYGVGMGFGAAIMYLISFVMSLVMDMDAPTLLRSPVKVGSDAPAAADQEAAAGETA